jgi:hypothetical protein
MSKVEISNTESRKNTKEWIIWSIVCMVPRVLWTYYVYRRYEAGTKKRRSYKLNGIEVIFLRNKDLRLHCLQVTMAQLESWNTEIQKQNIW